MAEDSAVVCLSHLRWDWVYQRPQHLMSRFAKQRRVLFVEEPIYDADQPHVHSQVRGHVVVITPRLPRGAEPAEAIRLQRNLLDETLLRHDIRHPVLWYYTPMALPFSRHLAPVVTVFDCMDELTMFKGAPQELLPLEDELLKRADVMFVGGLSLFERKRSRHSNVHLFPSSVDAHHFRRARAGAANPVDQSKIPGPRLGYAGVIDERMNFDLICGVAAARPDFQIVLLGPITKINEDTLPRQGNIHYLGAKPYDSLPDYFANWTVALMPFAKNDSTRYISPTKTPEYLAAGLPVVSTSIRDVVRPYGEAGLVHIADNVPDFVAAVQTALAEDRDGRLRRVDAELSMDSWDRTWREMDRLVSGAAASGRPSATAGSGASFALQAAPRASEV